MKWYIPNSWPKALKIVSVVVIIAVILMAAFFSQRGEYSSVGYGGGTGKAPSGNSTASAAPARPSSPAIADDAGFGDYNKAEEAPAPGTNQGAFTRKIIKEGRAQIQTKEFENSLSAIDNLIAQSGGFAEMREVNGNGINRNDLRYAYIVFRVPADKFESIMQSMDSVGTVVSSNTSGTDITEQYMDIETRIKNLKIQEQTLQDLMAKAEKLEDVITLEARMAELRYEIESRENELKNYDRLVQYSRISVNLAEVVEVTQIKPVPRTLGERISDAFSEAIDDFTTGLEDFTIWMVANWITFIFIVIIAVVFIAVMRKARKKNRAEQKVAPVVDIPKKED
jgi:hypothetical protein